MKLEDIYAQVITEVQGISPQARAWAYVIKNVVTSIKSDKIIIDGHKYPEIYQHFPVDIFNIQKSAGYAGYDENISGYDEDGKYVVYLHIPQESKSVTKDDIASALNHELRHAFEDYQRISKNKTRFSDSKESKLFYSGDFENFITGRIPGNFEPFKSIIRALYLTSKIEESAYSETIYDNPNHDILLELKGFLKRNYLSGLKNDKVVQKQWDKLKEQVKIPILDKFDDYMHFVKWADELIQKRATKFYRKLLKVKYLANVK
jgi:hypothetical protein